MSNHRIRVQAHRYRNFRASLTEDITPTPMIPWTSRRLALIQKIASRGDEGLPVNIRYCLKTNTGERESRDVRRLIEEGYAVLGHKTSLVKRPLFSKGWVGKQYKSLTLTEKGRALVGSPVTPATGGPYAKRKASLAS